MKLSVSLYSGKILSDSFDDPISLPISDIEKRVAILIDDEPQIKINEMASRLNITENRIKYAIKKLKSRGILKREGAKQSSKWVVIYDIR